jgi:hypothetical protein
MPLLGFLFRSRRFSTGVFGTVAYSKYDAHTTSLSGILKLPQRRGRCT